MSRPAFLDATVAVACCDSGIVNSAEAGAIYLLSFAFPKLVTIGALLAQAMTITSGGFEASYKFFSGYLLRLDNAVMPEKSGLFLFQSASFFIPDEKSGLAQGNGGVKSYN